MKKFNLVLLILSLAGCCTAPTVPPLIVKDHFITRVLPSEHLEIPDYGPSIDVKVATQKDVAAWAVQTEQRMLNMETKLKKIKQIQDDNLANDKQQSIEKK